MATKDLPQQIGSTANELGVGLMSAFVHFRKLMTALVGAFFAAIVLLPLYVIGSAVMKTNQEYFQGALALPPSTNFDNLRSAWYDGGFINYIPNSIIVVSVGLTILITICTLAAYALVQFDIPHSKLILIGIVAGFMIPPETLIVPLYEMMNALGWLNQLRSVIVVYIAFSIPFSVFFLRQFFVGIPTALADAARVDGCSEFQVFTRIYLPLSIPAITVVFVFNFVLFWNEFLYAIVFLTSDAARTAPAGLLSLQDTHTVDFVLMASGVVVAAIPTIIVFLIFRNYFIQGFTMGRV